MSTDVGVPADRIVERFDPFEDSGAELGLGSQRLRLGS